MNGGECCYYYLALKIISKEKNMGEDGEISGGRLYRTRLRIREKLINVRKLIDPWSAPHFLFGTVMAFVVIVFSLPVMTTFFAMLIIALLWEWLEKYFRLSEAPGNAGMDVLLPLFAFAVTFFFVNTTNMSAEQGQALLIISIFLYIFVNFFAWRARFEHDREFRD